MKATICVLAGDGVGPEVTAEAVRALEWIEQQFDHEFLFIHERIGGAAIDFNGVSLPEETRRSVLASNAVLLGAVGGPKWSDPNAAVRPEQGLLQLRGLVGAFANVRPVRPHEQLVDMSPIKRELLADVDIVFVRELTGGVYFGEKSLATDSNGVEHATDVCTYTTTEVERVARIAGQLARSRRGKVTSVDKANVLETSRLWRRTLTRVMRDEYPDISVEHALVDSFAMQVLRTPALFDVVVTENLFGDILTDEAAVLAGSIGVLPSASFGERLPDGRLLGIYEPIHGSAPDIAGRSVANPIGAMLSAAMLLRHSLGLEQEADHLEHAVSSAIHSGYRTADIFDASNSAHRLCSTKQLSQAVEGQLYATTR